MDGYTELKEYIRRGDLKEIAQELNLSYSLVTKVFSGDRQNTVVELAILDRAKERKQEMSDLERRKKELIQ